MNKIYHYYNILYLFSVKINIIVINVPAATSAQTLTIHPLLTKIKKSLLIIFGIKNIHDFFKINSLLYILWTVVYKVGYIYTRSLRFSLFQPTAEKKPTKR